MEEFEGLVDLDVRGQQEDRHLWSVSTDGAGGLEALGLMPRWHPDVHDGQVRSEAVDEIEQSVGVVGLSDDIEPRPLQQAGDALAQEDIVIGQHDPGRRSAHGAEFLTATRFTSPLSVLPTDRSTAGSGEVGASTFDGWAGRRSVTV